MENPGELISLVALSLAAAVGLVFLGELTGSRLPVLQKVFMPGAVLGGLGGLLLGPQLFAVGEAFLPAAARVDAIYALFSAFPGFFINVVFACLMLGKPLQGLRAIWRQSRRQVVMGHVIAWGQYVVGLSLVLFLLAPFFGLSPLAGPIIAIGFQGGHGTAAGLEQNFQNLGFGDGVTIAYAVATFGIIAGAVGGSFLATILSKRHPVNSTPDGTSDSGNKEIADDASDQPRGKTDASAKFSPLTGQLTLHLALIGAVIGLGWLILQGLQTLEMAWRGVPASESFVAFIPLFSVVLLVGFAMQGLLQKAGWDRLFDRTIFDRVSTFALDMVIFGALASLQLSVVGDYWVAILILCLGGLLWNLSVLLFLGPKIYPQPWPPYGLGDFGGGTATTAAGLLLIRIADPWNRTGARRAYSGKQPFYEPFMGGGLVTAFALPLVAAGGAGVSLAVTAGILAIWAGIAWRMTRHRS